MSRQCTELLEQLQYVGCVITNERLLMRTVSCLIISSLLVACSNRNDDAPAANDEDGTTIKVLNSAIKKSWPDRHVALTGGPEYWVVTGVPAETDLEARSGTDINDNVIMRIGNETRLRNEGCERHGTVVWCKVARTESPDVKGWVNGQYLRAPDTALSNTGIAHASGDVACGNATDESPTRCQYRIARDGTGNATLWISAASGDERLVEFVSGEPTASVFGTELTFERANGVYALQFGESERYEFPEQIISGD
jgi:hypothetical protein